MSEIKNNIEICEINVPFYSRMYALRKVRDEFRENKTLQDSEKVKQCYTKGEEALELIKRQVALGSLYSTRPLVIESKKQLNNVNK